MLDQPLKETIRRAYADISKNVPNFRSRASQRLMIAEITKTMTDAEQPDATRIIAVEGPTGTGKTLAYLLSTIPTARALQKKLVISTATIALQEQLVEKDIPLVLRNSGLIFRHEIAKGRGRYLCPSKVVQIVGNEINQSNLFPPENRQHVDILRTLYTALEKHEWCGDRDRWPEAIADDIWMPLTNDRHGCLNARCRFFYECPFYVARNKLDDADVIVANHDLVLADLMLGGGVFLPEPEDSIYVFDEAHHLAEKAVEHSGNWMRLQTTVSWLEGIPSFVKQCLQVLPKETSITADIEKLTSLSQELVKQLNELYLVLARFEPLKAANPKTNIYRFPSGKIDEAFAEPSNALLKQTAALCLQLEKNKDWIGKALSLNLINTEQAENLAAQMGQHVNRAQNLYNLWSDFTARDNPAQPPKARWIETITQNNRIDFHIAVSPVSAADWLAAKLWSRCFSAVLTSATLTALGSFSRLRYKTGLPNEDRAKYLKLESPFNYHDAATLWIPHMRSDPTNSEEHTREIATLLPQIIGDDGGTLVLFSSRYQMERVVDELGDSWRERLLVQNSQPKHLLLQQHKQKIEAGRASVIFGLASFAEGIDLPGDLCTHVVIAKLPFSVPDTPVEAAEREYLESQGKNHFFEVALTDASIKLNQAVGRLLRTETDVGVISLLDRRVITKAYGKLLLNSLPPMKRSIQKAAEPA